MSQTEPLIGNISDTARWAAVYRARESDRQDALFKDPFARQMAGEAGEGIAGKLPEADRHSWAWAIRTYLIDRFIASQVVRQNFDTVINLAAGLDARPYRMALPSSLRWIEVDLPEALAYKEEVLGGEEPVCVLERVRLDLADVGARRELFEKLGGRAGKALIVTEGFLIYLTPDEVTSLGQDLAAHDSFQRWILDLQSPGLLRMLQRDWGEKLSQAGAPLEFGPEEGPEFFTRCGWQPVEVRSVLQAAARSKRLSLWLRLLALLPESTGRQGARPWSGVCLLRKAMTAR